MSITNTRCQILAPVARCLSTPMPVDQHQRQSKRVFAWVVLYFESHPRIFTVAMLAWSFQIESR